MNKKSKVFIVFVVLSAIFCFLYEAGHTYGVNGDGSGDDAWQQEGSGDYTLNSFSLGLNKGEYSLSFQCHNDTGHAVKYALSDMEHNDGKNHLGVVVAGGELDPGENDITVSFVLDKDSYKLQLSAQDMVHIGNWSVKLVQDSYTDGIFMFLFIVSLLAVFYFKTDWKRPQYWVILSAIAILITMPFAGEILNAGHDLSFHLSRIRGVAESLSLGQFPVRVNTDMNQGYGYVSEMLYPDLFVYFPAALTLLGMSVMAAYKYWILAINIATALVGYYSFSRLLKSDKLGAICGLLYLINPYRLNNIFLRASIGELLAEIFLPLLIYALAEMVYGDYKKWKLLAVSAIGILQSHVLSLEISILFVGIFCVISWRRFVTGDGGKRVLGCLKAAAVVLALNMWFLVPFLDQFRKKFYLLTQIRDLSPETVQLQQMFSSFFHMSGHSIPNGMEGEMPLTIGIPLLLGSICYLYYSRRVAHSPDPVGGSAAGGKIGGAHGIRNSWGRLRKIGDISLVFGVLSCFMASDYFPWNFLQEHVSPIYDLLGKIQYPWRMLGFASLFLCIVTTIGMHLLFEDGKRMTTNGMPYSAACCGSARRVWATVCPLGILFVSLMLMVECMDGYVVDGQALLNSRDQDAFYTENLDYYSDNITDFDTWIFKDIGETVVTDGDVKITGFEKRGTDISFHFTRSDDSKTVSMRMPLYNYGLYGAYMNGVEVPIQTGEYGMLTLEIPKGVSKGDINVVYIGRKLYKMGGILTLAAILILVVWGSYLKVKNDKHSNIDKQRKRSRLSDG